MMHKKLFMTVTAAGLLLFQACSPPKGDVGPEGLQGDPGKDGTNGKDGQVGAAGVAGDKGPAGDKGQTGPAGSSNTFATGWKPLVWNLTTESKDINGVYSNVRLDADFQDPILTRQNIDNALLYIYLRSKQKVGSNYYMYLVSDREINPFLEGLGGVSRPDYVLKVQSISTGKLSMSFVFRNLNKSGAALKDLLKTEDFQVQILVVNPSMNN